MNKKYPKGLVFLFLTEMWERFSYYGISAILILYLITGLGVTDKEAALASGTYIAFTFMTPILGGFVADRVLGLRRSVTIGGIFILLGNLLLAMGGGLVYVFSGLALVAIGTGFLKSTVSVMVGKLYKDGDTHRDSGYTLFYMGINVGALLAGLIVTYVAEKYGWTLGFYLAAVGMLVGLIIFQFGYKYYNNAVDGFERKNLFKRPLVLTNLTWTIIGTIAVFVAMVYLFQHSAQTKVVITYLSMIIVAGISVLALTCKDKKERNSIFAILIIILAAICFQALFKQMNNSLTLFVDRDFNKELFGIHMASSFFALVPNALAVVVFASVFTWLWAKLADNGQNPSIPTKIVIALCFAIISSGLLAWVASGIAETGVKASAWWVILAIAILTLGELNILPMGLSAVSALAPKRYSALLMGSWFLCSSVGGYFSGFLTSLAEIPKDKVQDVVYTSSVYYGLYWKCALALVAVAIIMLLITPFVNKLMAKK
ncbi:MAG: peptide MFS transporter [Bacillota bacterium]